MRILMITTGDLGRNSSGSSIRTNALRQALAAVGDLDTIHIVESLEFALDEVWSSERVRRLQFVYATSLLERTRATMRLGPEVARVVDEGGYDIVVVRYVSHLKFLRPRHRTRTIVDADDIAKTAPDGARRTALKLTLRNVAARGLATMVSHAWVTAARDARGLRADRWSVLPNIVPVPEDPPDRSRRQAHRLLMVGLFTFGPNVEAARWFVDAVLPRVLERYPDTELHLVGRGYDDLLPEDVPSVRVRGYVDDLVTEYELAALAVAPLRSGGGTQIKVIDALAHGCPMISSEFAHQGFADLLLPGRHLLTAASADDWVSQITAAFEDPERVETTATRGREVVSRVLSPAHFRDVVAQAVQSVSARDGAD